MIFNYKFLCMYLGIGWSGGRGRTVCSSECRCLQRPEESVVFPKAGVISDWEVHNVGAGN